MPKPILYSAYRSSASWRVRIVLAHKGIDYEYKAVNLKDKEQHEDAYLKINPMAQVPAFEHDGKTIAQSIAIMEFLEEIYPEKPLLPKDPFKKAKVREICELIATGIQPLQNNSTVGMHAGEDLSKEVSWRNFWISKGLKALEKILSETSGKYSIGDELTFADCCLLPQVSAAYRWDVSVDPYPNVLRIYNELSELDAFKKADAFVQPDCPPELRRKN